MKKSLLNAGAKELDLQTGRHLTGVTSYAIALAQNDTIKEIMVIRNAINEHAERKSGMMNLYLKELTKIDKSYKRRPELHRTGMSIIMSGHVV